MLRCYLWSMFDMLSEHLPSYGHGFAWAHLLINESLSLKVKGKLQSNSEQNCFITTISDSQSSQLTVPRSHWLCTVSGFHSVRKQHINSVRVYSPAFFFHPLTFYEFINVLGSGVGRLDVAHRTPVDTKCFRPTLFLMLTEAVKVCTTYMYPMFMIGE